MLSKTGGGGGKDFFDGAHIMMKVPLGVGGVKPKFRKVPRVVFLCLGGGVGCQTEISKSTRVLFLRKMTIISLEINGKCIYF